MRKFLLLGLLMAGTLSAQRLLPPNISEGMALLDAGKNLQAVTVFKQNLIDAQKFWPEELNPAPCCHLYIAIAYYRNGKSTYEDSKIWLGHMLDMKDPFYSNDSTTLYYAFLLAGKTNDKDLFRNALNRIPWKADQIVGTHDDSLKMIFQYALKHVKLDANTREVANRKLAMLVRANFPKFIFSTI